MNNATILWNLHIDQTPPPLRLLGVPSSDGHSVVLSWDSGAGIRLQETKSLSNPAWQVSPGSESTNTMTFPALDRTGFFRLVKP